mgnify:FL=1
MLEAQEIINQLSVLSYFGIGLVAFMAKLLVILPEEAVLLGIGYITGDGLHDFFLILPIVILGTLSSDVLIYVLARRGNKWVSWMHKKVLKNNFEDKEERVTKNISKIIFFSRFMMQLRILGPFLAGHVKMPFRKFLAIDFLACMIYVPFYLGLGYYFQGRLEAIFSGIGVLRNILITLIIIVITFFLLRYIHSLLISRENDKNLIQ